MAVEANVNFVRIPVNNETTAEEVVGRALRIFGVEVRI